jgi:membrane protein YqaA with SNARE-associated domain
MIAALIGLAVAAFAAATPLPVQSEPVVLALMAAGLAPLWLILTVASVFNVAGSVLTFGLARAASAAVAAGVGPRWLQLPPARRARAEGWFARWGVWGLLLSWAPGGDVIVVLAGLARAPWARVVLLLAVAKTGRYLALAALAQPFLG